MYFPFYVFQAYWLNVKFDTKIGKNQVNPLMKEMDIIIVRFYSIVGVGLFLFSRPELSLFKSLLTHWV